MNDHNKDDNHVIVMNNGVTDTAVESSTTVSDTHITNTTTAIPEHFVGDADDEEDEDEDDDEMVEEKKESSSTVDKNSNNRMLFLAKDGNYYNSYMEQRAANIRYNENKLQSVGLGGSFRFQPETRSRKRSLVPHRHGDHDHDVTSPRRTSGRLRQQQQQQSVSRPPLPTTTTNHLLLPVSLEELPTYHEEDDRHSKKKKELSHAKFRRIPSVVTGGSGTSTSTNSSTVTQKPNALPLRDRHILQLYERSKPYVWIQEMELYLKDVEHLSYPNYRNVLRQVEKLITGTGITYTHWQDNVSFPTSEDHPNPISLSDDMDQLYIEALEFETEHGRDLGNGTYDCL